MCIGLPVLNAPPTATDLLVRAADRDRDAFQQLYLLLGPRVKGYLMRFCKNAGQAEELTQEVLLTAWRRADRFDPKRASAQTWIFTIARNRVIDVCRRKKVAEADLRDPMWVPAQPEQSDIVIDERQRAQRVQSAVDALPDPQRTVVEQAFFQGQSYPEIAESSGVALGTVKSRARLAFERLRAVLGNDRWEGEQ